MESVPPPPIPVSDVALRSHNPIRKIMESLVKPNLPEKPFSETKFRFSVCLQCDTRPANPVALSLGDPTIFGNLLAPDVLVDTVAANLRLVWCIAS